MEAWKNVVAAAGDVYGDDLAMGLASWDLSGHWRDELVKIQAGIAALRQERAAFQPKPKNPAGPWVVPTTGVVPGVLSVWMANGHYELTYTVKGPAGPMWLEANGSDYAPPLRVAAGETKVVHLLTTVRDRKLELAFHATSDGNWNSSPVSARRLDPWITPLPATEPALHVEHRAALVAEPRQPLHVAATVSAAAGIKWVRVRYRGLTQHEDFKTLPLRPTGQPNEWAGTIPAEDLDPKFDFMYFFEVMDQSGQGRIFPDLTQATPYYVVPLRR